MTSVEGAKYCVNGPTLGVGLGFEAQANFFPALVPKECPPECPGAQIVTATREKGWLEPGEHPGMRTFLGHLGVNPDKRLVAETIQVCGLQQNPAAISHSL